MRMPYHVMAGAIILLAGSAVAETQKAYFAPHEGVPTSSERLRMTDARKANVVRVAPNVRGGGPTFNVVFDDVVNNTNVGFDDPTFGAARQATVLATMTYLSGVLADTGTCDIIFENSQTDGSGFLAAAGTSYFLVAGFAPGFAFEHITTGTDPDGGDADIGVTFDFGYTWNSELDAPTGGEFDLFSTTLHEVTHGLGIASLANSDGSSAFSPTPVFTTWDGLLQDASNVDVWNDGTFAYQLAANGLFSGDGTVKFSGPLATAELGSPAFINTPVTFAPGSSVSHWQTSLDGGNSVMQFSTPPATQRRAYRDFELQALADLGYTLVTTPPASVGNFELYH